MNPEEKITPSCDVCKENMEGDTPVLQIIGTTLAYEKRIVCSKHADDIKLKHSTTSASESFTLDKKTHIVPVVTYKASNSDMADLAKQLTEAVTEGFLSVTTLVKVKKKAAPLEVDLRTLDQMIIRDPPEPIEQPEEQDNDQSGTKIKLNSDMNVQRAKTTIRNSMTGNARTLQAVRSAEQKLVETEQAQRLAMIHTGEVLGEWIKFKSKGNVDVIHSSVATGEAETTELVNDFSNELEPFHTKAGKVTRKIRTHIANSCINMAKLNELLPLKVCISGGLVQKKWPAFRRITQSKDRMQAILDALKVAKHGPAKTVRDTWKQAANRLKRETKKAHKQDAVVGSSQKRKKRPQKSAATKKLCATPPQ